MRSVGRPARNRARRSRAPRPSRSRARSRGHRGPGRPPTRSSRRVGSGTIRSIGMPTRCQSSIATSSGPSLSCGSPACTVTQMRSQSSCMCSRTNSRANSIAPSLKYCPNEKLPSISKNVRWWPSRPTSSMSCVRKDFCEVVEQRRGRLLQAEKVRHHRLHAGLVSSVERSSARGTSEADGTRL